MDNIKLEKLETIKAYCNPTIDFPPAMHDYLEFIYVVNGSGTAVCDGKVYRLESDDMFLVFPNQLHSYEGFGETKDSRFYTVLVNPVHLRINGEIFKNQIPQVAKIKNTDPQVLKFLELAVHQYLFGKVIVLQDIVSALINLIFDYFKFEDRIAPLEKVHKILIYCNENYKNDISVKKMSKDLYISECVISKIFSSTLHTNFNTHINSLRLEDAKQLMQNRELSMAEIAMKSGFNTIRAFNHAFRKKFGMPPRDYIKAFKNARAWERED